MPKVRPWYSTRPVATKHHDNTRCIEGNNVEGPEPRARYGQAAPVPALRRARRRGRVARRRSGAEAAGSSPIVWSPPPRPNRRAATVECPRPGGDDETTG